ncbi:hypothetical protein A3H16_00670 [Candidatus Kaiserbacteria bacterium RIFCSPLOWO2_12_FULL_53_8]|uniref:Uncharacterized protein n=2 Tax=Candidatus Kaiseribacteriota TaxID=1752734 RepID=A0A1F6CYI9_9BACT|nr:MAG: hypothetical protein A2851_01055 [Candidatus Kaiserbacteria bacterium RIFCSPHIGHO2_01_FULL_53_29]OGG90764.1 MAG: hypothetical protein A3H16_00670 [Candidatus Kaiserbacteria bacterium RIFCSPLOWO2_12_FULL_53_8]
MIERRDRLELVSAARCVSNQLHTLKPTKEANRPELLKNAPIRGFFAFTFTRVILLNTRWSDEELKKHGECARNALSFIGVMTVEDIVGKKKVTQRTVIPGEKGKNPLTLEQIAFAPGMTADAAALTIDLLMALGHTVKSEPGSWKPPPSDDERGHALLSALGIAA